MDISEAIVALFEGTSAITDLTSTRIYVEQLPAKSTLEAIVYQVISTKRERAMGADPGLAHTYFQFSCWAETYLEARAVAKQVRLALQAIRKETVGGVGGVSVESASIEDEEDELDTDTGNYVTRIDDNFLRDHVQRQVTGQRAHQNCISIRILQSDIDRCCRICD